MQPCHVLNSLLVTVTFELLLQTDKLTSKNSALKSDLPLNEKPKDQQNNTSCVTLEEFFSTAVTLEAIGNIKIVYLPT